MCKRIYILINIIILLLLISNFYLACQIFETMRKIATVYFSKKKKKNIRQRNGIFWWRAMVCRRETSRYRAEKAWIVAFVIDTWTHQCFHCNFLLLLWSTRFQVTVDSCFELWHRSSHVQEYFHNTGKTMHRDRLIFATLLIVYPKLDVCR